ncbi:histidine phosphotransferase family protein [Antarcticimicrobium sediminis]|uniref:Histidine phosphotransferase n=1 Tax=Antarcticimicrobium sediminis TaxID=2546227 RepID=A0A4R5EJ34_9RHOB|nr:histidine phosphotransferase family protein [Antarcticimicrobium sediminis]TDE34529.1 histidine phosphotransferase [Antarcticimicrobium sediminis]
MENPSQVNPKDDAPDMSALIASRICHDLIGPIGAIVNGMELLELVGGASGPEHDLIAQSANSASARLRFFRIAFGAVGEQVIGQADIKTLLQDIGCDGRLRITWHPEGGQTRGLVKLAFLSLLCCEAALPRGGQVDVIEADGAWTVTASGTPIAVDPALWDWLTGAGKTAALIPAKVQFALLPLAATQMGRTLRPKHDAAGLTLRF